VVLAAHTRIASVRKEASPVDHSQAHLVLLACPRLRMVLLLAGSPLVKVSISLQALSHHTWEWAHLGFQALIM
jgi:hypothetical protein